MRNRHGGRLSEFDAICGGLHCTRYDSHFQTKPKCVVSAALLSSSDLRGLPLVDNRNKKVKCETCGFFSKHGRGSSAPAPRYYEVETTDRTNTNEIFRHFAEGRSVSCEIVCFQHKLNFMAELNRLPGQSQRNDKLVAMVRQNRNCESWYPYRPGFSPKEHYEELQMQRLEQDRRAFEKSLADMALSAQLQSAAIAEKNAAIQEKNAEIAEASKQLVSELKEIAQKSDSSSKRIAFLVILLAIAQVVVGLMSL
jgi:hypothetical protein